MRLLIQRVSKAAVAVDGEVHGQIGRGLLVFVGVTDGDTKADADKLAHKVSGLRVFEDEAGKMNLGLDQCGGELLIISQFTLYGSVRKGFRPSFTDAADPADADELYRIFIDTLRDRGLPVETGVFGAHMDVELINDGPVPLLIESRNGSIL